MRLGALAMRTGSLSASGPWCQLAANWKPVILTHMPRDLKQRSTDRYAETLRDEIGANRAISYSD